MPNTFILLFILLCLIAGIIWLQFFLSRSTNKWYGLILPVIAFMMSMIVFLNVVDTGDLWKTISLLTLAFLLANIPTVVLLIIYLSCRDKRKKA